MTHHVRLTMDGQDPQSLRIQLDGQEVTGCRRLSLTMKVGDAAPVLTLELLVMGGVEVDLPAGVVTALLGSGAEWLQRDTRTKAAEDRLRELARGAEPGGTNASALASVYMRLPQAVRLGILRTMHLVTSRQAARASDDEEAQATIDREAHGLAQAAGRLNEFRTRVHDAVRFWPQYGDEPGTPVAADVDEEGG